MQWKYRVICIEIETILIYIIEYSRNIFNETGEMLSLL